MSDSAPTGAVERSTAMAVAERQKLQKSLRRFDMLFFTICALVGLDTLGQVSSWGAQTFTWLIVLAVLFVLPYALIMAELGSSFTQEGGPYEWMKLSWGRFWAGIGAVLYWVTNPLWVGGSLAFISTAAWSDNISKIGTGTFGDYFFKLIFIWISIGVAIVSLRRGKWIPNAGAIIRIGVLAFFSVTVLIYAIEHGVHGYSVHQFGPSTAVFLGLVPLLLFNYVGFELQNGAAEEMIDPQKDVPKSVGLSGLVTVLAYAIPIFGILEVLPTSSISGIAGFLDAVHKTFSVYGGAQNFMVDVMALGFIFALVTSGSVWMMGSDRIQAVAAYDGAFVGWFGVFNKFFGTPVRVNVMSGVVSTIFMIAAEHFATGSNASTFTVVLYLATSTTLLSYLLIFPAIIKLRYSHPDVHRPYRMPFGMAGVWVSGVLCTAWMLLGSWAAVFPGTIDEYVFNLHYSMQDAYGVSRSRFEVFTLGTLGVVVAFGVVGYLLGKPVRDQQVDVPLAAFQPASGD
ncbi:MAG: glutamate:GABA antiporter [Mycobacterium sp.]|jgi:amino acid transporter|nr:glutamate:GABA antiporter [Mycobacterium sp.]